VTAIVVRNQIANDRTTPSIRVGALHVRIHEVTLLPWHLVVCRALAYIFA